MVAPESCRRCYSEDLALMPNCYFVNDYKRAHLDVLDEANIPSRAEVPPPPLLPSPTFESPCSPSGPSHCSFGR